MLMKQSSSGALTGEQKEKQNARYREGHIYDYVIIGTGNAALTVAALLAHAGKKICMLEAHDTPGGYAHSFSMGDFSFCAQVHYIWGAGPGGRINAFLKKLGLERDITFELLGPQGYDLMSMSDGKKIFMPYGWDALAGNIEQAYPGQRKYVDRFTGILSAIRREMNNIPEGKPSLWDYLTQWYKFLTLIRYRNKTVQDVFDECGLSKEAQLVLIANAGDLMEAPKDLSIFIYAGLLGGYNTGAYYPTKHFKYYIQRIADFITEHDGCHIYYETEVTEIRTEGNRVASVETRDGKTFEAPSFICNMDPQRASTMIGQDKFPQEYMQALSYEYSPAGIVIYLGLKDDIDLREYGFGNYNIWHCEQWDMNAMWEEMGKTDFTKPWIFLSTPTLHSRDTGNAPKGHQILEIAAYTEYQPFKDAQDKSYKDYLALKNTLAKRMIDLVQERFIPDLRSHILVQVVGTSATNDDFCLSPRGNAYGSRLIPANVTMKRLKSKTPFHNLRWCNASSGWPSVYGTVVTGTELYMELTGDHFFSKEDVPSDDVMVAQVRERLKRESKESQSSIK